MLEIARAGAAAGCTEALFTLGDKPELRYRVAREELAALGCATTLEYLARCARPRARRDRAAAAPEPGRDEPRRARAAAAGLGVDGDHARDDCRAAVGARRAALGLARQGARRARLETIRLAGELAIPFTSGILIGIGETRDERLDALLALQALDEEHGHIGEVIVQNFRAKPETRMADHPDADARRAALDDRRGADRCSAPDWHVQAPPNLAYDDFPLLLDAGIDDWGGVSPVTIDHVNPEAPVARDRAAARRDRARAGSSSPPRLPLYPEYVADLERWVDPAVAPAVLRASDAHRARPRGSLGARASRSAVPFLVRRDALAARARR